MKVLCCGSRSWHRHDLIRDALTALAKSHGQVELLHGDARGADKIAADYGRALSFDVRPFPADWRGKGKRAGIIRNLAMLDDEPDLVIAWWDGKSTGTKHTIDEAENRGIPVVIYYEQGGTDWR